MEEQQPQVIPAEEMANYVVERLATGESKQDIASSLTEVGVPLDEAVTYIDEVVRWRDQEREKKRKQDGWASVSLGAVLLLLGTAITWGTWYWAGPGGTYAVTIGLFLWGGYQVIKGIAGLPPRR